MSVEHFHNTVADTALGAALSISAFSSAVTFLSELKSSWLDTKHSFHHLAQPGVAKWDPLAQYSGIIGWWNSSWCKPSILRPCIA